MRMPRSGIQQNQSRLQGASLEQARGAIKSYLLQQRTLTARQQYLDGLRAKIAIRIMLDPPRQVVAKADRPSKGPETAPIETDRVLRFPVPVSAESAFPTVNQVLNTYGDRIHFIYRHYPLAIHPRARPAAEASQCAAEQGKFWQFHDKLFGDQSQLGDEDFKQHAAQLGLDTAQFNACVDSRKYQAEIDNDIHAGDEAGVSGTPAFYINGRMLSGAQPFEAFKRIIDEELNAKKIGELQSLPQEQRQGVDHADTTSASTVAATQATAPIMMIAALARAGLEKRRCRVASDEPAGVSEVVDARHDQPEDEQDDGVAHRRRVDERGSRRRFFP